jgi:hypothetical protein
MGAIIFNRRSFLSFLFWMACITGCIIVGYVSYNFFSVPVNPDAGCYIPMAKEIINGATPTVDVDTAYMPLVSYFFALWIKIFGDSYNTILVLILMFHFLNAGLLYIAMGHFRAHHYMRILLCFSYFFTTILCDGIYVVLEPFQIFFSLLAYISLLNIKSDKWTKYALTGFLIGLSILSKQHSGIFAIAFALMVLFEASSLKALRRRFKNTLIFCVFTLIPFGCFIVLTKATFFGALHSFGFLGQMATDYIREQPFSNESFYLIQEIIKDFWWIFFPIFILILFFIFPEYRKRNDYIMKVLPLLVLSLSILSVRQYKHYFQLILPWSYLGWAVITDRSLLEKEYIRRNNIVIQYIVMVFAVLAFLSSANKIIYFPFDTQLSNRQIQEKFAKAINQVIPEGSFVFIINDPSLYVLSKFFSPIHNYGFNTYRKLFSGNSTHDLCKIENLIVNTGSYSSFTPSDEELKKLGFKMVNDISVVNKEKGKAVIYKIFKRTSFCSQ